MSNPVVELKEEDRKLLRSVIESLSAKSASNTAQATSDAPNLSPTKDEPRSHGSVEEILECKDCGPKVRQLVLKEYAEKLKGHALSACEGCGLVVREEEEECPNCGSTKGKHI